MKIDVKRLESEQEGRLEFGLNEELEPFTFKGERISFQGPVEVRGTVEKDESGYLVFASVRASVLLKCARCLKEFEYSIDTSFSQSYSEAAEREGEEEEVLTLEGDIINLEQPVMESIILDLPIKGLCSEACKGLCPMCGKDRNIEECHCKQDDIDLRLTELKKLLEE